MKKFTILIFWLSLILNVNLYANSIQIIAKVQNDIITNIDIENEIKYLLYLNPKLKQLTKNKIINIAKNSLVTEIIKEKELEKIYNIKENTNFLDNFEKNFLKSKNINGKSEFIKILNEKKLNYEIIKKKFQIEALWNKFIYNRYSKNIRLDENKLRQNILKQYKNESKKYEFNLSEIFFTEMIDESLSDTLNRLNNSIDEIGFENTANIYSLSNTSKNGGYIGWINELQISESIKKNIISLKNGETSEPIQIGGGYLLIKLNNKREFQQTINVENQLKELINKETNRQLNTYSVIFYKRLKKNIEIYEF